jgi:hypothetical protein
MVIFFFEALQKSQQKTPLSIVAVQDDIVSYAIQSEITGKIFPIQPEELAFYCKYNIPLTRRHHDKRHLDRLVLRK